MGAKGSCEGRLEKKLLKSREENPAGRKWLAVLQLRGAELGTGREGLHPKAAHSSDRPLLRHHSNSLVYIMNNVPNHFRYVVCVFV